MAGLSACGRSRGTAGQPRRPRLPPWAARLWPLGFESFMASAALNALAEQRHRRRLPEWWARRQFRHVARASAGRETGNPVRL